MILESHAHLLRPGELTTHCRSAADFEVPIEARDWDADGFPKKVLLKFRSFKTMAAAQGRNGSTYTMQLQRNYTDPRFCPVLHSLLYMTMASTITCTVATNEVRLGT